MIMGSQGMPGAEILTSMARKSLELREGLSGHERTLHRETHAQP